MPSQALSVRFLCLLFPVKVVHKRPAKHACPTGKHVGFARRDTIMSQTPLNVIWCLWWETGSRNAEWWATLYHNVTAMIGAGVLGLPYAMTYLGMPLAFTHPLSSLDRDPKPLTISPSLSSPSRLDLVVPSALHVFWELQATSVQCSCVMAERTSLQPRTLQVLHLLSPRLVLTEPCSASS